MQDPDPTLGNKPFLPNDKGFWNKKAPFKSEKGAKIITHKRVSKWSLLPTELLCYKPLITNDLTNSVYFSVPLFCTKPCNYYIKDRLLSKYNH